MPAEVSSKIYCDNSNRAGKYALKKLYGDDIRQREVIENAMGIYTGIGDYNSCDPLSCGLNLVFQHWRYL
jgi:hypothetical protein